MSQRTTWWRAGSGRSRRRAGRRGLPSYRKRFHPMKHIFPQLDLLKVDSYLLRIDIVDRLPCSPRRFWGSGPLPPLPRRFWAILARLPCRLRRFWAVPVRLSLPCLLSLPSLPIPCGPIIVAKYAFSMLEQDFS